MKIHMNHPTPYTVLVEARKASGVQHERCKQSGSRTHHVKFDVILSGESGRKGNMGGEHEAATWDQWGIYLAVIFDADPEAKTDHYASDVDFHRQTGGRFIRDDQGGPSDDRVLSQDSPDYKITAHRWQYTGGYLTCKGHSTPRNKRADCTAVLPR